MNRLPTVTLRSLTRIIVLLLSAAVGSILSDVAFAQTCTYGTLDCYGAQDCGKTGDFCYSGGYPTRCGFNCGIPGVPCTCYVTTCGADPYNACSGTDFFTDRCSAPSLCACSTC